MSPFPVGLLLLGTALLLNALSAATILPSSYGVDSFLAFADSTVVKAMITHWGERASYARAFLRIDLFVFIPIYAWTLLRFAEWTGSSPRMSGILCALASSLVAVDLIETGVGLARLDGFWAGLAATALALVAPIVLLKMPEPDNHRIRRLLGGIGLAIAILLLAMCFRSQIECAGDSPLWELGCSAHRAKWWVMLLIGLLLLAAAIRWCAAVSARLRSLAWTVAFRSRYVLLGLALVTVVMLTGQTRGILLMMVSARPPMMIPGLVAVVVSLWTLSHSSWLWARVLCLVPSCGGSHPADPDAETFARLWARALGLVPLIAFALLAARTLRDLTIADMHDGAMSLLVLATAAILMGALFLFAREKAGEDRSKRYFDDPRALDDCSVNLRTWNDARWRFWFLLPSAPIGLPLAALALMTLLRAPVPLDNWPPMALATLMLAFSVWFGVFGWIALMENRHAVPYSLLLLIGVGGLGACGWTDNHVMWTIADYAGNGDDVPSEWSLWRASAALACAAGILWYWLTGTKRSSAWMSFGLLLAATLLVLLACRSPAAAPETADVARKNPQGGSAPVVSERPSLDESIESWIWDLRASANGAEGGGENAARIPVYFIITEGGGMRAAYFTARLLSELHTKLTPGGAQGDFDEFPKHVFAISGVSGGALGAAAYKACLLEAAELKVERAERLKACVDRFGAKDAISPLLGAWMFDDALARVVPSRFCSKPGCGFLSRGIWFETSIASSVPKFRQGLQATGAWHAQRPFLLLNSTWVETGERAIASDLAIDESHFPAARDVLTEVGDDLALVTAAHNASRFPFVNAPGAVVGVARCKSEDANCARTDPLGHIVDGGYFDNSGAMTMFDVLRGFLRWLQNGHDEGLRIWARTSLRPILVVVQNGGASTCTRADDTKQPSKCDLACRTTKPPDWTPQRARKKEPLKGFANSLAPPYGLLAASGVGAHQFHAQALLKEYHECTLALMLGTERPKIWFFTQRNDGFNYPLGWALSKTARDRMNDQIEEQLAAHIKTSTD